jgi:hypothetical protein
MVPCPTTCGSTGSWRCTDECRIPTDAICRPPAEACNGQDDDCDGVTDNGFDCVLGSLNIPCTTPCGTEGTGECTDACTIPPVSACAAPERCANGIDDDCDGETDERVPPGCLPGEWVDCATTCGTVGRGFCTDGCVPPTGAGCYPPLETCDGRDDDCDTTADDGFDCAQGADISCGTTCGSVGEGQCTDECELPTTADCDPPPEACNGLDDDCDGDTDDDLPCLRGARVACITTCGSSGTGICTDRCMPPAPSACEAPLETCNAVDDDCDGETDDGFECARATVRSCTTSCGSTGTQRCSDYCRWDECVPPAESCNALDDDCDGAADNGFPCIRAATVACPTSCGTVGTGTCSDACLVPPPALCTAPEDVCNGVDDDCDGDTDGECPQGSEEPCATRCGTLGSRTCSEACAWGACVATEVCNGCDDDADTVLDDGVGACAAGTARSCTVCGGTGSQTCASDCSGWGPCARAEQCNGCDDDADTTADDGFGCRRDATEPCTVGGCDGTRTCSAACEWGACEPSAAVPSAPALLAPENGGYTGSMRAPSARQTLRPEFRWAAATACGAATYEIQVDDSCSTPGYATCDFASPEAWTTGLTATSYRPSADLPVRMAAPVGRRYYWRVRACDGAARCSPWSAVRYVDVGRVPADFNGDGWSDVFVGAPGNDAGGTGAGRVYVYFGGATPDSTADVTMTGRAAAVGLGTSLAAAGDVNADGFGDILAGEGTSGTAYLFLGGATPDGTADTTLGGYSPVAGGGDLNGDGFADVVVAGSAGTSSYVYLGGNPPNSVADATLGGSRVSDAGDVNGDGFADALVGAGSCSYLYLGATSFDSTADITYTATSTSVAIAGDLNGDGYADVALGPVVFLGAASPDTTADGTFGSAEAVAGARDTNGDGYADLLTGVASSSRAYAYLGAATLDTTADLTFTGSSDRLGSSVAGAGDVNGDGYADLVVGAPYNDAGGSDAGRAYIYFGGATLDSTADLTLTGAAATDYFGSTVAWLRTCPASLAAG